MIALDDFASVRAVLKDSRFAVGDFGGHCRQLMEETGEDFSELIAQAKVNLFVLDGEDHVRKRRAVHDYYKPKNAMLWGPVFASIFQAHIDAAGRRKELCLIADVIDPIIIEASVRTIGLAPAPHDRLRSWIDDLEALIKLMPSLRTLRRIEAAMRDYTAFALAHGAKAVSGDPLTLRQQIEQHGSEDWTQRDIEHFLLVSFNACWATKRTIGNILSAALAGPGLAIFADRAVLRKDLNRHLRCAMPIEATLRCPREDVSLLGEDFSAGQNVLLRLRDANFDEEQFPPGDNGKQDRTHMTFGAGAHACLGQHIARVIVTEILAGIGQAYPRARLRGNAVQLDTAAPLSAVKSLQVSI